jgi:hypothetical protein
MNALAARFGLVAALIIGLMNSTGIPVLMCLSPVALVLCSLQASRRMAAFVIGAYYLGCAWPVCVVLHNYYGTIGALVLAPIVCAVMTSLLAVPFMLAWSPLRRVAATRLVFAVVASALPLLGIIGIGSPLTVAGILFPGSKWFGLILTLILPSGLLLRPKVAVALAAAVLAFFHARFDAPVPPPNGWAGVSTKSCPGQIVECEFKRFLAIQRRSSESHQSVLVFPEAAVENWNDATELFWQDTNEILRRRGATVLIGATVHQNRTTRNVVLIRGAEIGSFAQRIPVPVAMWRPFDASAVPLNLTGPATVVIHGRRAAVLICYEQLIPWTWISALIESPDTIIAPSNDEWSHGTPLPHYRSSAAQSWSTLFGLPVISATNY